MQRQIWVRRRGASATLIQTRDNDLVDNVRQTILEKYANTLGRTFDAPDITLRLAQRIRHGQPHRHERVLGPEEEICRAVDRYYPGGQTVENALIIDVPPLQTPQPSPTSYQPSLHDAIEGHRHKRTGAASVPSTPAPTMLQGTSSREVRAERHSRHASVSSPASDPRQQIRAESNPDPLPPLPSPRTSGRHPEHRLSQSRERGPHSPTAMPHPPRSGAVAVHSPSNLPPGVNSSFPPTPRGSTRPSTHSSKSDPSNNSRRTSGASASGGAPLGPSRSRPPTPPLIATSSHAHRPNRSRSETQQSQHQLQRNDSHMSGTTNVSLRSISLLDNIPPINVLIVEDNPISLRVLQRWMTQMEVRWQTAMNGRVAIDKWKVGGFHLVLMDIQMPVMDGLAAAQEIRRLERKNGIGIATGLGPASPMDRSKVGIEPANNSKVPTDQPSDLERNNDDELPLSDGAFRSPVIIVALTASSLASDRHEALTAGCNDFLTKPVDFPWLKQKVREWGCMQALIDFDGWKKWKDDAG